MKKYKQQIGDIVSSAIIGLVIVFLGCLLLWARFHAHKSSMERMVGHPVSNWDAFWTQ